MIIQTQAVSISKEYPETSLWKPFEKGNLTVNHDQAARVVISDSLRRPYFKAVVNPGDEVQFLARGAAGRHEAEIFDSQGNRLDVLQFALKPETWIKCNDGPYGDLAERIRMLLEKNAERRPLQINGKLYRMLVTWGRDHVHTLKAQKYFIEDVKTGLDYWLDTQEENGMFWDCIHANPDYPAPSWFGEALGEEYYRYDDGMKYIVRRIPIEADCEFLYTEGVWYAWKASGDDAWMKKQLPRLEKALKYNSSNPARWSERHGLVRRSFCMDSWDFANPFYCNGDHRCINPGDPQFLFHSDNSGLYSSYWRMAEMYEAIGNHKRASELREEGEAFRERANRKLFFENVYGHMIPEDLPEEEVYAKVGDERKRMSLSTGYTINRKLPTHEMAVKIIREYQRRRAEKQHESFAEWWTMDPPYTHEQWPANGPDWGEYMNGAICAIIAGEVAKAAFDHGCEAYGTDILERVWALSERDGGELHQVYRRLPESPVFKKANFKPLDMRAAVNRGLCNGAFPGVKAWTDEGDNDMRNLPLGEIDCGPIKFEVIDPKTNAGKAVLYLPPRERPVEILAGGAKGKSVYFMHSLVADLPPHALAGIYEIEYKDGSMETLYIRNHHEIGHWWGVTDAPDRRSGAGSVDRRATRVAWRGTNPVWKNVGLYMTGWNNPQPGKEIAAIRVKAAPQARGRGGIMLAAISVSDRPVEYEERIRSYGLPDCWAQAAVYYAISEGLAGIEDRGRAFDAVSVAPRWAASRANEADVVLHYPASDGYCGYVYRDDGVGAITLDLTGSFNRAEVHCLLREGAAAVKVTANGKEIAFKNSKIEASNYVDFVLEGLPGEPVKIEYKS
ncbi:MAG: hypothetical protein ACM3WV_03430 [Bacillota bacterium]